MEAIPEKEDIAYHCCALKHKSFTMAIVVCSALGYMRDAASIQFSRNLICVKWTRFMHTQLCNRISGWKRGSAACKRGLGV